MVKGMTITITTTMTMTMTMTMTIGSRVQGWTIGWFNFFVFDSQ